MWSGVHYVARYVGRVPSRPEPRTVMALAGVLVGIIGVAGFGIGLVEALGGIWFAFGFVGCTAVAAVAGFDLAQTSASAGPLKPPLHNPDRIP